MAGGPERAYTLDASSWIAIEHDPAQNRILHRLGEMMERGQINTPPEAWDEVKLCPQVIAWMKQYGGSFIHRTGAPEYYALVGEVTHRFPAMAGARRRKERADPYVVATAVHCERNSNPTTYVAVTEESDAKRPNRKIGTACKAYGVGCCSLKDMLRREFPDDDW